jgi:dUTP pyrophosphatase
MSIYFRNSLHNALLGQYDRYMLLRIKLDSIDDALLNVYLLAIENHNQKVANNINHIDAGFDVFVPENVVIPGAGLVKINFQIQCAAQMITDQGKQFNTGFYMYPRSSISNTPLRLANSVGIVDAGYRGNLIGAFDPMGNYIVNKHTRLTQICAPGLVPIVVELVNDLGEETARGSGGFGSSGG